MSRDDYVEVGERLQEFIAKYPDGSLQLVARELVELPGMGHWWIVEAHAYRTPDDPRPGVGVAQEAVPGRTQFTRGSELMNAETSAWGRAMAALGIATKKGIATGHEVRAARARQEDDSYGQTRPVQRAQGRPDAPENAPWTAPAPLPPEEPYGATEDAAGRIRPPAPPAALRPASRPDVGSPSTRNPASDKSIKMMWALLRKTGMTEEQTREWVAAVLPELPHDWHTDALSQAQVSSIIDRLKSEEK